MKNAMQLKAIINNIATTFDGINLPRFAYFHIGIKKIRRMIEGVVE